MAQRNNRNSGYVYGNAARAIDVQRQLQEAPRRRPDNVTRKNRDKAHYMSFGYVLFLMTALCVAGIVLINYIQIQAEITNRVVHISKLESQWNNLRLENDEEYSRITSSVDLEEVKRVAIGELGMTYAKEGQIVSYTKEGTDYFRKVIND